MLKKIFIFVGFLGLYQLYDYYMLHYYQEPIIEKHYTIFHCFPPSFNGDLIRLSDRCDKGSCKPATDTLIYYYNDKGCRIGNGYEFPRGSNIRGYIDKEYYFEYDFKEQKILRKVEWILKETGGDRVQCDTTNQFSEKYGYELIRLFWNKKDSMEKRGILEIDNEQVCNCVEEFYQFNKNKQ